MANKQPEDTNIPIMGNTTSGDRLGVSWFYKKIKTEVLDFKLDWV